MLAWRAIDGSAVEIPYVPGTAPWRLATNPRRPIRLPGDRTGARSDTFGVDVVDLELPAAASAPP